MASSGEGPIRHTVTIKLKNMEDKFKVADGLRALKALPGVTFTSFTVVTDLGAIIWKVITSETRGELHKSIFWKLLRSSFLICFGIADTNADVSLIADFADKESYLAYANHPQHLSFKVANKDHIANVLAIQFDVPAKL